MLMVFLFSILVIGITAYCVWLGVHEHYSSTYWLGMGAIVGFLWIMLFIVSDLIIFNGNIMLSTMDVLMKT